MSTSFGLRNQRGSCWVNATIQALFRIPDIQTRYQTDGALDTSPIDVTLQELWSSKGEEGLKPFYECVKTAVMPAGEGIGDSHELLEFLCNKLPFLDKLCRFKTANKVQCSNPKCGYKDVLNDSMIEFSISPTESKQNLIDCIAQSVSPVSITDWTCEKCKQKGCTKQLLMSSFPSVFMFHVTTPNASISYNPILTINKQKYALFAVVCFNGGHWWTYGRDMPPGKNWIEYDDASLHTYTPEQFPLSDSMRLLFYYRLKE